MRYKNIEAVFFDAADTLFYIREGLGKTYLQPAIKYGVTTTAKDLKKAFSRYFPSAPPLAFPGVTEQKRKELEKEWWYDVVRKVYIDVGMFPEFDNYFEELFEIFRTSAWEIFPETSEVLNELKSRNYKLIVVSNFDSRVYDVCKSLNILHYFDDFLISSEAGYAKPDTGIFKLALKRNNLNSLECVHIGDNFENDYESPSKLGINTIFLDREDEYKGNNINKIRSLSEILNVLD